MRQSQLFYQNASRSAGRWDGTKRATFNSRRIHSQGDGGGVFVLAARPHGYKKIENIIREEMNAIGGVEMKTSVLQNKEVWEKSNRCERRGLWKTGSNKTEKRREVGLSFNNEEAYSTFWNNMSARNKDLPINPYDFKEIFRTKREANRHHARQRILLESVIFLFQKRSRAQCFMIKQSCLPKNYSAELVLVRKLIWLRFRRALFPNFHTNFQTVCDAGEDTIYTDEKSKTAVNKENLHRRDCWGTKTEKRKISWRKKPSKSEIFSHSAQKFSEPFGLKYKNEKGEDVLVLHGLLWYWFG